MSKNLLQNETSPYLLQHSENPVQWMPWGEEAFRRAREENKPILLSIGYAACHWCHVMAHECFENPEIAALMNEHLVNVKVDREERPDLDVIYQSALAMLGEQGGWPLTMFLTPEGEPFWGGTYFPPTPRYGRPGFPEVIRSVAEIYRREPERIRKNVAALREGLARLSAPPPAGGTFSRQLRDSLDERLTAAVDRVRGGLGGAPKFPQPTVFEQIWRAWKRTGRTAHRDAVLVTLDNICQGGIYDHLGGGFARYAVDERWLVPHFEKMLYDNAELVWLLTLVWQETRSPLYAERVAETIGWVLREMATAKGAFASSLDADSEGEEGRFYVWTEAEIDAVLGERAAPFKRIYGVTPEGNWEGRTILHRLGAMERLDPELERSLAEARARLFAVRAERVPPARDDKVLADWNGLMIAALAFAGEAFGRPDWVAAGARAFAFVRDAMTVDGRLRHSWRAGRARHPATLDDYANLCRAALALHEATADPAYIEQTEAWIRVVDTHYRDPEGGYFLAANDTPHLIARTKTAVDMATPSGNGTLAGVLARLYFLTGKNRYRERAEEIVTTFAGEAMRNGLAISTLLNASELLDNAVQITILGDPNDPETAALRAAANGVSVPNRILSVVPPDAALPEIHPAAGKTIHDGRPTAYVCRGPVCSPPVTSPDALAEALGGDHPHA